MVLALIGVGVLVVGVVVIALARRRGVEVVSLTPPPPGGPPVDASPEQHLRAGNKIAAIKRFRELHGVGLKEAKDAVEAMERGQPWDLPPKTLLREVNDSDIEAQIRRGALIDAIKLYREKTGVGLKEAKDAVEAWRDRLRAS